MKSRFVRFVQILSVLLMCVYAVSGMFAQEPRTNFEVVTLPENPGPQELSDAKAALAAGQVLMREGRDVTKFDSLLDVGLEKLPSPALSATESREELQLMAARLGSNGSLHSYECYMPYGYQEAGAGSANCVAAFQEWLQKENEDVSGASAPDPFAGDWTELGRPDVDFFDRQGSRLSDRVRLYRVNDINFEHDWYMVVRDPLSVPNNKTRCRPAIPTFCGYLNYIRDFQTSLDRGLTSNTGFTLYDWSPKTEIKTSSGELAIGFSLDGVVPKPGVGYTYQWSQPDVRTMVYTNVSGKEGSWVETFGTWYAATSNDPFTSHNAMIFQVPEGTSGFPVRLYNYTKNIYANFWGVWYKNPDGERKDYRTIALAAPVFNVTPNAVDLVPRGTATLSIGATIPGYSSQGLRWRVAKEPPGFSVTPSSGAGSIFVTIRATSAQVGDVDTIEFDTDPSFAAPSVTRGPLAVLVKVVAKPATQGVLLAGGTNWSGNVLASAEVWDPATRTTTLTQPMHFARRQHTATVLNDGRILVTGGFDVTGNPQKSAEIFDPSTGAFVVTGDMSAARAMHTATLLTTGPLAGDVLIAGGCCAQGSDALQSYEIYDPRKGTFSALKNMPFKTLDHAATQLANGDVMITGGTTNLNSYVGANTVQFFHPATQEFEIRPGVQLQTGRRGHAATLLMNGQVLLTGGWRAGEDPIPSAELFTSPGSGFAYTGSMDLGRRYQTSTLLTTGNVLVAGGHNGSNSAVIYSPNRGTFEGSANLMLENRDYPKAALILNTETEADQMVLIAGGVQPGTGATDGKRLELYNPSTNAFTAAGKMTTGRSGLTVTLFHQTP